MNRILSIIVAAIITIGLLSFFGLASAQTLDERKFYENHYGLWNALGLRETVDKNAACGVMTAWKDGSTFMLIQDLTDGELYIEIAWKGPNFFPNLKENGMKMQFMSSKGNDHIVTVNYMMYGNQSAGIGHLLPKVFLPLFTEYEKVRLMPDNTDQYVEVELKDSRTAIKMLTECVKNAPKGVQEGKKPDIDG